MAYSYPNQTDVEKPIDFWLRKGKAVGETEPTERCRRMIEHILCENQTDDTQSRQNRNGVITWSMPGQYLVLTCLCLILFSGCSISYKFNGANINYQTTHSISIADFPNNAPMVNPTLSVSLTEAIQDLYRRQTRLEILPKGGDLELEGEIVGYEISQGAISTTSYASESKLTVRVAVHFTNNIYPEESFDKTYTAYQTFDANRLLTDVQDELCSIIITEIAESIYNDTVAKW